ncbi:MAG: hypothetical protein AAFV43_12915 [Planctomycetota bacterium]
MRLLLALVGYLCTATVVAAALGVGYLWQSEQLTDEKVFRMVAIVHDIDIDGVSSDDEPSLPLETPDEEPSLDEMKRMRQLDRRDFEVRKNLLDRGSSEFQYLLDQLVVARGRYDAMAQELNERIQQEKDLLSRESIQNVVRNLKSIKPTEAKEVLLQFLDTGMDPEKKQAGKDKVIRLLNALPADTAEGILKKFKTPEELTILHDLLDDMLSGGAQKRVLDETLELVKNRQAQG